MCVRAEVNELLRQARPEPRLAVVTHSSFLFFMLLTLGGGCDERIKGELHRWCAAACKPELAAFTQIALCCPQYFWCPGWFGSQLRCDGCCCCCALCGKTGSIECLQAKAASVCPWDAAVNMRSAWPQHRDLL